MKASDLLVRCLEIEGVKYIFALPGEEIQDILFSLEKSSIEVIVTRHEQAAAFMADVWGRLTGRAGVCLSTLGPGATNLITGLGDAHLDKSPVVAITGQGDMKRLHKESHQFIDIVNMFKPIVKWNIAVHDNGIIPEVVRKSFKLSQMEKPGVTHIEIPEDIAESEVDAVPLKPTVIRRPAPDYKAITEAIALLKSAKRPIILAGNGAIRKRASKHLRMLVEKNNIPVVSTFMGKGAVSDNDSHSLFSVGIQSKDYQLYAFEQADLILTVGFDIAELYPTTLQMMNAKKDKKIIHIDFEPSEVYEYFYPDVEIIADISATLWELNKQLESVNIDIDTEWYKPIRAAAYADIKSYELQEESRLTVPGVLHILRSIMAEEDIIISDVGSHKVWIGRNFPVYKPGTCIISNGFASMGIAVPGGIAAKLAYPARHVVAAMGDGGFLMNSQEIETAKRIGANFTILLFNDNNYGLITWKQQMNKDKHFATQIKNPDFLKYAESFGIKAYHPKTKPDVVRDLTDAVQSNELNLVVVDIDPVVNVELSKKLKEDLSHQIQ